MHKKKDLGEKINKFYNYFDMIKNLNYNKVRTREEIVMDSLTGKVALVTGASRGIGSAIVFALYKPLAENDESKIASLMRYYAKAYRIIGIVVGSIGFNPMQILLIAQALNGLILPIAAIYVVIIASSVKQLKEYRNGKVLILLGSLVCLITIFLGGYSVVSALKGLV